MIFVLRLDVIDKHLRMLMLSFLFVVLCGPFQSTKIFACYCYCFVAAVQVVHLFSFLCCVFCFICRCWGSKLSIFLAFCVVFSALFVYVLFSMLPVSLECQILIAPSGFSNFYVYLYCH